MRVWHLLFLTLLTAVLLRVGETPAGRVAIVIFFTGLGLIVFGVTGLMALFQTVGSLGTAESFQDRAQAVLSTALVLLLATSAMTGVLAVGGALLRAVLY